MNDNTSCICSNGYQPKQNAKSMYFQPPNKGSNVQQPKMSAEACNHANADPRGPMQDMVERTRGEWRQIHGPAEYYCSHCGEEFEIHSYDMDKYRFCPYCMSPMTDEAANILWQKRKKA